MAKTQEQSPLLSKLKALNESELQRRFIVPLLKRWGYQVYDYSGPYESGKDLVAIGEQGGFHIVCAVQIKNKKLSGAASGRGSLTEFFVQALQMLQNPIHTPFAKGSRPNALLYFNPHEINRAALVADEGTYSNLIKTEKIEFYTGFQLLEALEKMCPEELEKLDDSIGYLRIRQEYDKISESGAFPGAQDFSLSYIYIEAEFAFLDLVAKLLLVVLERMDDMSPIVGWDEKDETIKSNIRAYPWMPLAKLFRPSQPLSADKPESDTLLLLVDFCYTLRTKWNARQRSPGNDRDLEQCLITMCKLQRAIRATLWALLSRKGPIRLTADASAKLRAFYPKLIDRDFYFSVVSLSWIRQPVLVLGRPGAGKTSLLRMLSKWISEAETEFPSVLLRAIDIEIATADGIFQHAKRHLERHDVKADRIEAEFRSGKRALLIDGLDEVQSTHKLELFKRSLRGLQIENPKLRLIVSSRDSVDFSEWTEVLHLSLKPFSDPQLASYIDKYFHTDHEARNELKQFLFCTDIIPLREICRTPMVAFLLCSLYQAGADLPTTEVELYQRRFELLLGRWQHAKGIRPMPAPARRGYETFLRRFAFWVHAEGVREFSRVDFVSLAKYHLTPGYNQTVDSFFSDLIDRGIFEMEDKNTFSFGHLTYQEFLCAEYFFYFAKVPDLAKRFGEKWWRKVLFFWAAMVQDIDVLKEYLCSDTVHANESQIRELLRIAKLSSWDPLGDRDRGWVGVPSRANTEQLVGFRMGR